MSDRESTVTARVVHISVGPPERVGWHYIIEGEDTEGPFATELDAGKAARDVILARAEKTTLQFQPEAADVEDAKSIDHRLDRVEGRNKYAVVSMRKVEALPSDQARTQVAAALGLLRTYGLLNDGDPGTEGEFFVLMLKDQFADLALLRYADAAKRAGMSEYADDVLQLSIRAGHGSPWCKRPD